MTLVEVLVVAAITAILIGIVMPTLSAVQGTRQEVVCASMQRQLAMGLAHYASTHDEWIPGYATSGVPLWGAPPQRTIQALYKSADRPVQVNDWISPALSGSNLPEHRDARFHEILEKYGDPAMPHRVPVWAGGDLGASALADWIEANRAEPARGLSYLMSANFQVFGAGSPTQFVRQTSSAKLAELGRVHIIPAGYRPRFEALGAPDRKVAFADGFRYIDARLMDFDGSWSHQNWGSFSERTPCDPRSRSWGRLGGGGTGLNIPLAYRHAGRMNAAFWDGHVARLTPRESRNPALWAPKGSKLGRREALDPDSWTFGYDPVNRNIIP